MRITNVVQGTQPWHELRATKFTASEAPAMMGASKYQSRDALLKQKATGERPEVNSFQEKIFARGHAAEDAARPLVEKLIGEELFPATAISDEYDWMLASFDGITLLEDIVFEHKLYNQNLFAHVLNGHLEPHYYWQLEQQLLVSGAEKAIFVCSDGTNENLASCEYVSLPERREQLIAGWLQFQKDLANYEQKEEVIILEAEPIRDLPALTYKMDGLTLNSNFDIFKKATMALIEKSKLPIETDQEFADTEQLVKVFKGAEDKLKALSEQVLGEVQSIDAFIKELKFVSEQIRQARLAADKQVKNRKDEIRKNILNNANAKIQQHLNALSLDIKAPIPTPTVSVLNAMKGKKTVQSLEEAADTTIAQALVEADLLANKAKDNYTTLSTHPEYQFLFNDWATICFKDTDDFNALVKSRIADHKAAEDIRLEQERQQMQIEADAKAQAKVEAQQERPPANEENKQSDVIAKALEKGKAALSPTTLAHQIETSEIKAVPMVQMTAKEANYLRKRDAILTALENAGVDNWSGYENAVSNITNTQL
ncbi:homogentisate 1,2-dioxygenase [Photobacterium phosphoreum]|uniref:Homogentisate 1,2-dioxygenase n=1 Tax=Photobacterium phosphoreum TaxID=659 RepID=A0A2T3JPX0_PHOPO|nr:YqaJ viral recombinase family protein [Photobacterium phosphoreum]PSU24715.1 homogentisate 1,2-dioxygenase [Photobacterium phosphoreum]PSU38579.1 homogentisate 1,2-dioxygenase [Photobacterium phosphoreum]PSU51111.1 homogentisate 1,2-dioxygenase [Photobacterium phosphoreum]